MPPRICDPDTESSDLSDGPNKERAPTAPQRQMLIGTETPLPYNSDDDDNNSDEMHYNIDTISNLNPEVLKGMLIKLTKHNKARDSNTYKKPSHCSNFRQRLSHTHDALKEAPKLTTKDWYAWNPRFRGILSNWPAAMKHLDGTVAPGDKKYNHTLDGKLCTILQSSALLAGNNNINYLFVRPANSEPWKLHNLYCRLKKDLTKMEKIAKSTLLNEVRKILMFQADVCKLIMNINEHWAKAESMGHALTEILKVKMLIDQARYVTPYLHCIITLKDTGMASSYEVFCATLCKCQDSMTARTEYRAGNIRSAQANLAEGQVKNEEAYHSDSGATNHVTNDESNLTSSTPCTGFVKTASGMRIHIVAVGQAMLNVNGHEVPLNNILYVPDANANLISVKALMNDGAYDGLSKLPETFNDEAKAAKHSFTPNFMHKQCGHPGRNKVRIIEKLYKVKLPSNECQDCVVKKSTKARMSKSNSTCARHLLELVHVNLTTHLSTKTEFTCLLVAVDDTSSFTYVRLPQAKSDVLHILKEWIHYAKIQTGHKLKTLHLDNGGKWTSTAATSWQNEAGFQWQKTSAYTSEQNSKAEHTIRTIQEMMITMMCTHHLPPTFWPFAAEAAIFTKNVMLNVNNWVPYHVFYDRDPRKPFSLLRTFGCLAWVNVLKAKCKKLDEPAIPAIFIGYDDEHKGWKSLAPSHNLLIFLSNSAHFLQDKSWNDHTDTIPIQDTDTLHYKGMDDIEDLG
ncbi:uncharacterized protein UBRO_20893 [Ustilago bromivora]|uniref:Integrase catalytic domain-containing protein n=1 Tax=Ustilago bromivora TaxID=307758 RepID=A0A1K0GB88_9BASI|nr:uncharacterized protein UBRO_20893 [Ustilago bromivora]